MLDAADHHVGVALAHGHDAEARGLAQQAHGLVQVGGAAQGLGQLGAGAGELLQQVGALLGVAEGALGEGELDPGGVHVTQFGGHHRADRLLRGQEHRPHEAGQMAGRLDDARIGGLDEDHRGPVLLHREDLLVQGAVDVVHWAFLGLPGRAGGTVDNRLT